MCMNDVTRATLRRLWLPIYAQTLRLLGAFADSAPDRWGPNLLDNAERMAAIQSNRAARRLGDPDLIDLIAEASNSS